MSNPPATIELTPEDEVASPDEVTFVTFDDQEVPLSSLRGTPTVVNFFASTCTPCITEMPAFEEVYQELGGDQLAFLGLAVADRPDDALALVEQTGRHLPHRPGPRRRGHHRAGRHRAPDHRAARRRR